MFTIYVQYNGDVDAQTYDTYTNMTDALEGLAELREEFDVVMCDADLDGARAAIDVDGQFMAGCRMRLAGADKVDFVAIVQEP